MTGKEGCRICEILNKEPKLYEDKICAVFHSPEPANVGHLIVVPKKHVEEMESLDDETAEHLLHVANKCSVVVFEGLQPHGTNIIMSNGKMENSCGHIWIDIIPRLQDDGMNFMWTPLQLPEEEMTDMEKKISDKTFMLNPPKEKEIEKVEVKDTAEKIKPSEDNYLLKQLQRRP